MLNLSVLYVWFFEQLASNIRELLSLETPQPAVRLLSKKSDLSLPQPSMWSCPGFVDGFRFEGSVGGWGVPFVVGG